jgi:hypothetical protein
MPPPAPDLSDGSHLLSAKYQMAARPNSRLRKPAGARVTIFSSAQSMSSQPETHSGIHLLFRFQAVSRPGSVPVFDFRFRPKRAFVAAENFARVGPLQYLHFGWMRKSGN